MSDLRPPVALYIHFPICLSICPYCDFVVVGGRAARGPSNRIDAVVEALLTEIRLRAESAHAQFSDLPPLASVYLGGGTPSLMSAAHVERVLAAVGQGFGLRSAAEAIIEVNPGEGERGDLAGFRAAGANRLSIGAQSFEAGELRRLGRRHSAADIRATVDEARRAGFDNLSLDLLYDVPGQTADSWRRTIETAVALEPEHVSAYALALDDPDLEGLTGPHGDHLPVAPGARRWRAQARPEQDGDRAAALYELADDALSQAGLAWYELSNWAVAGRESAHNLTYWQGEPWAAVGPGAHAFDGLRTRRWNAARIDAYLAALLPVDGRAPRLPPGGAHTTDAPTAAAEAAILRLRTRAGLPATMAERAALQPTLAWGRANGLLEAADDRGMRLTRVGRLLSNELFVRLLPDEASAAA